jgi:hypothetical protein
MLFSGRANPVTMVAEIEHYHRKARRAFKVAFYCSMVSAACSAWLLMDVIAKVLG